MIIDYPVALKRLVVVSLPQLWVIDAYRSFHDAAFEALPAAMASLQLGLLADTVVVLAIGLVTLALNGLIVAILLKRVAKLDALGYARWMQTGMVSSRRPTPADRCADRRIGPSRYRSYRRVRTPVGPVRPRRIEE